MFAAVCGQYNTDEMDKTGMYKKRKTTLKIQITHTHTRERISDEHVNASVVHHVQTKVVYKPYFFIYFLKLKI